jgi:hypothetical protein
MRAAATELMLVVAWLATLAACFAVAYLAFLALLISPSGLGRLTD